MGQQRPPQSTTTGENSPSSKGHRKAKLPLNRLQGGPRAERKELHQIHATALQPTSSSLLTEFRRLGNDSIIRHQRGKKNLILLIAIIPEFIRNFLGGKITRKHRNYSTSPAELCLSELIKDSWLFLNFFHLRVVKSESFTMRELYNCGGGWGTCV